MLALTEMKHRQIVPGMFDVDIDTEGADDEISFSVHWLYADDVRGYMFSQLGLDATYASVSVSIPAGVDPMDLPHRTWVEVKATDLRDANHPLYSEVPDWARQAFRDIVETAAERQMEERRAA